MHKYTQVLPTESKGAFKTRSQCSLKVVDEYSWYHEDNAWYTEVGEAVCMRSPEELPTTVGVKYTPEQSSQWSYQGLQTVCNYFISSKKSLTRPHNIVLVIQSLLTAKT